MTKRITHLLLVAGWAWVAGVGRAAEPAKTSEPGPGYTVTLDLLVDETGKVEDAKVVSSEAGILNGIALQVAGKMKLAPRQKDGVPIKYKVTAPLGFPVEGDGGPEAQKVPMPSLIVGAKYMGPPIPPDCMHDSRGGGAILQLRIDSTGRVAEVKLIRAL